MNVRLHFPRRTAAIRLVGDQFRAGLQNPPPVVGHWCDAGIALESLVVVDM